MDTNTGKANLRPIEPPTPISLRVQARKPKAPACQARINANFLFRNFFASICVIRGLLFLVIRASALPLLRHRCSSRYGYRDVLGVFQGKFSQLYRDPLDAESFEQVRCEPIGECLDQICRLVSHKILRFLSNDRIIDRVFDLVRHIALIVTRPERDTDGHSLGRRTFFFWNSNVSRNLQLLDMNPIGRRTWFVGHPASLQRHHLQ
jgi:hypothetical protein